MLQWPRRFRKLLEKGSHARKMYDRAALVVRLHSAAARAEDGATPGDDGAGLWWHLSFGNLNTRRFARMTLQIDAERAREHVAWARTFVPLTMAASLPHLGLGNLWRHAANSIDFSFIWRMQLFRLASQGCPVAPRVFAWPATSGGGHARRTRRYRVGASSSQKSLAGSAAELAQPGQPPLVDVLRGGGGFWPEEGQAGGGEAGDPLADLPPLLQQAMDDMDEWCLDVDDTGGDPWDDPWDVEGDEELARGGARPAEAQQPAPPLPPEAPLFGEDAEMEEHEVVRGGRGRGAHALFPA